jgi:hypothetical protein
MDLEPARPVLLAQAGYYLATGLLPFVSRRTFEAVTGPKREWWLVQTVGALVTVIGVATASATARRRTTPETVAVAAGSAASLAAIDIVHVARRRIAPTYLIDAAIELGLLVALARAYRRGSARRACPAGRRTSRPADPAPVVAAADAS